MTRLIYTVEFDPGDSKDWRRRLKLQKNLVGWRVVEALRRAIVEAVSISHALRRDSKDFRVATPSIALVSWPNDYYSYPPNHEYREPKAVRVSLRIEEV